MNLLVLLGLLQFASGMLVMDSDLPRKKCRVVMGYYARSSKLKQAMCNDLKLDHIPDNLDSDIEVRFVIFRHFFFFFHL